MYSMLSLNCGLVTLYVKRYYTYSQDLHILYMYAYKQTQKYSTYAFVYKEETKGCKKNMYNIYNNMKIAHYSSHTDLRFSHLISSSNVQSPFWVPIQWLGSYTASLNYLPCALYFSQGEETERSNAVLLTPAQRDSDAFVQKGCRKLNRLVIMDKSPYSFPNAAEASK